MAAYAAPAMRPTTNWASSTPPATGRDVSRDRARAIDRPERIRPASRHHVRAPRRPARHRGHLQRLRGAAAAPRRTAMYTSIAAPNSRTICSACGADWISTPRPNAAATVWTTNPADMPSAASTPARRPPSTPLVTTNNRSRPGQGHPARPAGAAVHRREGRRPRLRAWGSPHRPPTTPAPGRPRRRAGLPRRPTRRGGRTPCARITAENDEHHRRHRR